MRRRFLAVVCYRAILGAGSGSSRFDLSRPHRKESACGSTGRQGSFRNEPTGTRCRRAGQSGISDGLNDLPRGQRSAIVAPYWPHGGRSGAELTGFEGPRYGTWPAKILGGQGRDRTADLPLFRRTRSQKRDVCAGQAGQTGLILRVQSTRYDRSGGCRADENEPVINRHGPRLRPGSHRTFPRHSRHGACALDPVHTQLTAASPIDETIRN